MDDDKQIVPKDHLLRHKRHFVVVVVGFFFNDSLSHVHNNVNCLNAKS